MDKAVSNTDITYFCPSREELGIISNELFMQLRKELKQKKNNWKKEKRKKIQQMISHIYKSIDLHTDYHYGIHTHIIHAVRMK